MTKKKRRYVPKGTRNEWSTDHFYKKWMCRSLSEDAVREPTRGHHGNGLFCARAGWWEEKTKSIAISKKKHCELANQQKTFCTTTSQEKAFCKSGQWTESISVYRSNSAECTLPRTRTDASARIQAVSCPRADSFRQSGQSQESIPWRG